MNNLDQSLNYPTITGLKTLELDELTTENIIAGTIDGNIIYYNRIEGDEIIVDAKLTLTNNGVISVGNVTISDIELTYLDGVSSNIQTQINNINTNNAGLITTVNQHTTQINALEASDTVQNATLSTHTTQITSLQTSDTTQNATLSTHTTQINNLNSAVINQSSDIYNLQSSDTAQNATLSTHTTQITALQTSDTTQNATLSTHTTQITALQTSDTTQNATLSTHTTQINSLNYAVSGQTTSITNLQISDTTQNATLSTHTTQINSLNYAVSGQTTSITNLQTSDTTQNATLSTHTTQITTLQNAESVQNSKTQNIMYANTTGTYMDKKLSIVVPGQCLDTLGTFTNITGSNNSSVRVWLIGNESTDRKFFISNDFPESINLRCGTKSTSQPVKGWRALNIFSNGVNLYRGGTEAGNTQYYVGSYGSNQSSEADNNFYISSNGVNNLLLNSGIGNIFLSGSSVSLSSNTVWIGGAVPASNGRYSNINMLNSTGTAWETQSTAFTDTIRQEVATSTDKISKASTFGGSTGKISFYANFDLLGSAIGTTSLLNNTVYGPSFFSLNVGIYFRNIGYTSLFDTDGKFISAEGKTNFSMSFEMQFLCKNTAVSTIISRLSIRSNPSLQIEGTQFQGLQYRTPFAFNENILYSVGPFKHFLDVGQYIYLITDYEFTTQSEGTQTRMNGRFTLDRNVL
jgi:hypothetical protein